MTRTARLIWLVTPALGERAEAETAVVEAARNVFGAAAEIPEQRRARLRRTLEVMGFTPINPDAGRPRTPMTSRRAMRFSSLPPSDPARGSVSATATAGVE
jgi:hypothetical protein